MALGLPILAALAWFTIDALGVRSHLEAARAELEAAKGAVVDTNVPGAIEHVAAARQAVEEATGHIDGPLWRLAEASPIVRDTARLTHAAVVLADASVGIAEAATADADLVPTDGSIPLSFDGGRVDLSLLSEYEELLASLPLDELVAARDEVAAATEGTLPGFLRRAAQDAVESADNLLDTLSAGSEGLDVVQGMLGDDGPRSILIAIQNPSELRSAGGLIGFLAVLTVDDGKISLAPPVDLEAGTLPDDRKSDSGGSAGVEGPGVVFHNDLQTSDKSNPVPRPAEIARRYDHNDIGVEFESVTIHPDLPVVAPILQRLYTRATGVETDALVLVTPIALQRIQEQVGPVDVPDALAATAPTLPDPIPADQLAQVLLVDTYDALGGPTVQRREYQARLADQAFGTLLGGDWNPPDVVRALGESLAGRHLQIWSARSNEQAALERLGIAGTLRDEHVVTDDLLVTATNSAANKADSFARHRFDVQVDLSRPLGQVVRREMDLTVTLTNTFEPNEVHDGFIQNSWFRDGRGGVKKDERTGLMRTWFTYWLEDAESIDSYWRVDPEKHRHFDEDPITGFSAVDATLFTERGEFASAGIAYNRDIQVERDGDELVYRFRWRRQPKVIADELVVLVRPPDGWHITEVLVDAGPLLPTLGDVVATSTWWQMVDGAAQFGGHVTSDVVAEIRMAP